MIAISAYTITVRRPFEIAADMLLSAQEHHGNFLIKIKIFLDPWAHLCLECYLMAPIKMDRAGIGMRENQYDITPKIAIRTQHVGEPAEAQHDIVLARQ